MDDLARMMVKCAIREDTSTIERIFGERIKKQAKLWEERYGDMQQFIVTDWTGQRLGQRPNPMAEEVEID